MSNSSFCAIHWTVLGATTGSNSNEGVLHNPQNSKAEASPYDGLMAYSGYSLGLLHGRDTVSIFYSPNRLGSEGLVYTYKLLATLVEGDPKIPFSIATTQRCRGGRYSIPWIAPLYP